MRKVRIPVAVDNATDCNNCILDGTEKCHYSCSNYDKKTEMSNRSFFYYQAELVMYACSLCDLGQGTCFAFCNKEEHAKTYFKEAEK